MGAGAAPGLPGLGVIPAGSSIAQFDPGSCYWDGVGVFLRSGLIRVRGFVRGGGMLGTWLLLLWHSESTFPEANSLH